MNGWIVLGSCGGRVVVEPCNMNWGPLACLHVLSGSQTAAVNLDSSEAIQLRNALDAFIALANKPPESTVAPV